MVDSTPLIEDSHRKSLLLISFPEDDMLLQLIDIGFEGFAIVSEEVYRNAGFNGLKLIQRSLLMSDGRLVKSVGTFGRIVVTPLNAYRDGFTKTSENVGETDLGAKFLKGFGINLDYCTASISIDQY